MRFDLKKFCQGIVIGLFFVLGGVVYADCTPTPIPPPTNIMPTPTITPVPTNSPTPTPTSPPSNTTNSAGEQSSGGGSSTSNAPGGATCTIPFKAPILQGFVPNGGGSVTFSWWGSPNATKYSVTYGYTSTNLMYGEDNIPATSTSVTLNGLIPGHNIWAQVQAWQGGCEESSNLFDPIVR